MKYARGDLVITIDMKSTCLTLSPLPEWKKFEEKVAALPAMDELGEMLSRFVVGQAKDLQVDGSGRILIPPELRGYAQLEKKLVLVGRTKRLEIWSEENWNAEREKSQETYREHASRSREHVGCFKESLLVGDL